MRKHVTIVNFKTYPESIGDNAVRLAKICEKVALETGGDIRVAVSAPDIYPVSHAVKIPVYAQHVEPYEPGRHTGSTLPEMVKVAGASGTLLNHSEHRIPINVIEQSIARASKASLATVVCAQDQAEAALIASRMKPDFIAVEPPELIGGDISVSSARPELISDAVKAVRGLKLLVGAGIKKQEDVKIAYELGADGILVASGVTLARNQEAALRDLILR